MNGSGQDLGNSVAMPGVGAAVVRARDRTRAACLVNAYDRVVAAWVVVEPDVIPAPSDAIE